MFACTDSGNVASHGRDKKSTIILTWGGEARGRLDIEANTSLTFPWCPTFSAKIIGDCKAGAQDSLHQANKGNEEL